MESTTERLRQLLIDTRQAVERASDADMEQKTNNTSWSKKEMLGHLVDSAIHNLRRFVAAHYLEMPFAIAAIFTTFLRSSSLGSGNTVWKVKRMGLSINSRNS